MSKIQELKARRDELAAEMRTLSEKETLTRGEDERLARVVKGYDRVVEELRQATDELKSTITDRTPGFDGGSPTYVRKYSERDIVAAEVHTATEKVDMARRAVELVEKRSGRELRADLGNVFTADTGYADAFRSAADPAYMRAFARILTQGPAEAMLKLTDEERAAVARVSRLNSTRDMSLDDSGFVVPPFIDASIMVNGTGTAGSLRSVAKVVGTTSEAWRGVVSAGSSAVWTPELTEVTDNSPTLREVNIQTHKAACFIGPVSFELLEDWPGMVAAMNFLLESARRDLENAAFVGGSGSNEPFGLLERMEALTNYHIETETTGVLGQVDVYSVASAVPPRMRPGSSFVASLSVLDQLRQTQTDSMGSYFQRFADSYEFSILGKRVVESAEFPEFTDGTDERTFMAVGDFSNFVIVDRLNSSRVSFVPHMFGSNQRPLAASGILYTFRVGSDLAITNSTTNEPGIRLLVNKTS